MLMQVILIKLTLSVTEKLKQMPPKNETISIPHLLQAQAALALLLLACYCGSTTMCRWNSYCVDPNQTGS